MKHKDKVKTTILETTTEKDARIKAKVDGYKAKGGPITKEQLTDEVLNWLQAHGVVWYGKYPEKMSTLDGQGGFHASADWVASQEAFWNKSDAEHAKWLADMQSQMTPITPEQLELLHVGKDTVWAVHIAYGNSITREIYDGNKTFKCFHFSEASALAAKQRLDDYEHEKWIKNHESQPTPITPEQAKMLSRDDVVFVYDIASLGISGIRGDTAIKDNSYVTSPLFFTEQAARDRLNEVIAAQAALDKAKCSTLPEGVAPVPEGYEFVDPKKEPRKLGPLSKDGWLVCQKGGLWRFDTGDYCGHAIQDLGSNDCLLFGPTYFARPKAEAEPLKKHGHKGMIHYNNNNTNKWEPDTSALDELAKQAQELHMGYETDKPCVESHETPVGETQDEEVVTDETQPKPSCDAVSHPSHYTSHPSGVECITITKHMNFCRGNAMKYLWRAGQKGDSLDKEIEDIAKAEEYCRTEKERLIATKGAK